MARLPTGRAHLLVAAWRGVSFHMTAPLPRRLWASSRRNILSASRFSVLKVGSQAEGGEASLFSERFRLSEGQQTA